MMHPATTRFPSLFALAALLMAALLVPAAAQAQQQDHSDAEQRRLEEQRDEERQQRRARQDRLDAETARLLRQDPEEALRRIRSMSTQRFERLPEGLQRIARPDEERLQAAPTQQQEMSRQELLRLKEEEHGGETRSPAEVDELMRQPDGAGGERETGPPSTQQSSAISSSVDLQAVNTFDVNSTGDAGDSDTGDGICFTGNNIDGDPECTLRAAIEQTNATANSSDGPDRITFNNVPTNTSGYAPIEPTSANGALPFITDPVVIDGTTAPGYTINISKTESPVVYIDGDQLSSGEDGLVVQASGSSILALTVQDFPDDGIDIYSSSVENVTIGRCYIGTGTDGAGSFPNADNGIEVWGVNGTIGRINFLGGNNSGNVISGNGNSGIYFLGSATGNFVANNHIGLDDDGDSEAANAAHGVHFGSSSTENQTFINVISGNGEAGVFIDEGANANSVLSDLIGTNEGGDAAVENGTVGVRLLSSNNEVNASTISGNHFPGVAIGSSGSSPVSADSNLVSNNVIGLSSDESTAIPNGQGGPDAAVRIDQGNGNEIDVNTISGNNADGILLRGGSGTDGTVITGNIIGTNGSGDDFGNEDSGIKVNSDVTDTDIDGNTIGHNYWGIDLRTSDFAGTYVTSNFVGTNSSGDDLGNVYGISVYGDQQEIGGIDGSQDGNTIGHNSVHGIYTNGASATEIEGNYIGTNAAGDDLGNGADGISINGSSATNTEVGDYYINDPDDHQLPADGGDGNVIAFNEGNGVEIGGNANTTGHAVRGNRIHSNSGLGIDLGNDGRTANDFGDSDTGPNNLQNFPEFEAGQTRYNANTGDVEVRYMVNCNATDCDYGSSGLAVDFYLTEDAAGSEGQGRTFLHTDKYPSGSAGSFRNISFAPPSGVSVSAGDRIVAVATDASNNASEFSDAVSLGAVTASVTIQLQGPYAGSSSMNTGLNGGGHLPMSQPYSDSGYDGTSLNYDGSESVSSIPNSDIVDWVLVELRTGTSAGSSVETRAAFLLSDGSVVDLDGSSAVSFTSASSGSYYIVVRHRNHLPVMSASAVSLPNSGSTYDFTTGQGQAYDDGGDPMVDLGSGVFGMVAGDANFNGAVKYSGLGNDPLAIFNAVGNMGTGTASGYLEADVDLTGQAKYSGLGNDPLAIFNAVGNMGTGTRNSQVPE